MVKPTGYWFINCFPTCGLSMQKDKKQIYVWDKYHKKDDIREFAKGAPKAGICSEERSMISPDYARNFICDFIIGKEQQEYDRIAEPILERLESRIKRLDVTDIDGEEYVRYSDVKDLIEEI